MRTISKSLRNRLVAQAFEADFQGLNKVASVLRKQADEAIIREDDEEYIYSMNSLKNDIEDLLWKAAIRTQDYFGKSVDSSEISDIITSYSNELIQTIRTKIGGDIVGKYEPLVPGEERFVVEIDED